MCNPQTIGADEVEDLDSGEVNNQAMVVNGFSRITDLEVLEETTKINNLNLPLWGLKSIRGRMDEMEDSAIALPWFLKLTPELLADDININCSDKESYAHFFGVYDGHGGSQVSNYCKQRLHLVLAEKISHWSGKFGDINLEERWKRVLLGCFHKVDDEVGGTSRIEEASCPVPHLPSLPPIAPGNVGSTAVVAIICSDRIIVANCGDSRAVLCRRNAAIPLSVDHKPNRDDERRRIEAAGGMIIEWYGFRVSGILAMSRAIGDLYFKDYVISHPEITITPREIDDECLILASDGLWDVMTNKEACSLARRRILRWYEKTDASRLNRSGDTIDAASQDAAYYLSQKALLKGSKDNISVIVIDLKKRRSISSSLLST